MGTMSRFQGRRTPRLMRGAKFPRATAANRVLSGQTLRDVLTVLNYRAQFNRTIRRLVFSLFRRHAQALRIGMFEAIERYKGVAIQNDSLPGVASRLLALARR